MLSNKVIDYLNKQGVYSEKEDKAYKKALIDLGIDLELGDILRKKDVVTA